ncbi:MAG: hypothetical protein M3496_07425 [Pseudomonadota bacterium]|nr:hypothetical protein [Methylibium sp.]MDQ3445993.1 hypothetical protein [Pseudomonadota bacterium]
MKASALLWAMAGLIGWAAAFSLVYALHGIGCARGWDDIAAGPASLQRLVQVGAWLACLPPLAWLAWWLRRQRQGLADAVPSQRLLTLLAETSAWVGLAATVYSLSPVATTSVCI